MRSQRFKGGSAPTVTRFLAEHQACESGFNAERDDDAGGRLRIRCEGCGGTVAYRVTASEDFPVAEPDSPSAARGGAAGTPRARRSADDKGPEPGGPPARRGRAGTATLVLALGACAAAFAAFALLASRDEGDGESDDPAPSLAELAPSGAIAPAQAAGASPLVPGPRRVYQRFSILVPTGWSATESGDEASFAAPGGESGVAVFFGSSELSSIDFAQSSELFLAQRHTGSVLGPIYPAKFNGWAVARIRNSYNGGEEVGTFFTRNGTSYVLLLRVDDGAPGRLARQADSALASFRPR